MGADPTFAEYLKIASPAMRRNTIDAIHHSLAVCKDGYKAPELKATDLYYLTCVGVDPYDGGESAARVIASLETDLEESA